MRFFAFVLLALIAISCVSSQSYNIQYAKNILDCINNVKEPCQTTGDYCQAEKQKINECSDKCKTDQVAIRSVVPSISMSKLGMMLLLLVLALA
ncbi:hypothetical protein TTHERM_00935450 (macronuclear) [Tetrahymena thermophila SB210]|uniref:Transmembrane protein n=1 Tax=Tetrahymena thermophila (strain SB210) TaxID=312017 RepID=Q23UI9_TETTS|nr:hypothetical protein TTHERM_00935450 [Tetrahymena thermophila SB210]EAS00169.2 hypothetical protein TTHERM_00935450 [Tetrahymena thermophila SB210]|eukprot:XP_001020414.2 hypothetical protein TTHERM_00935450 [Tetrahymena thermophila SB210]